MSQKTELIKQLKNLLESPVFDEIFDRLLTEANQQSDQTQKELRTEAVELLDYYRCAVSQAIESNLMNKYSIESIKSWLHYFNTITQHVKHQNLIIQINHLDLASNLSSVALWVNIPTDEEDILRVKSDLMEVAQILREMKQLKEEFIGKDDPKELGEFYSETVSRLAKSSENLTKIENMTNDIYSLISGADHAHENIIKEQGRIEERKEEVDKIVASINQTKADLEAQKKEVKDLTQKVNDEMDKAKTHILTEEFHGRKKEKVTAMWLFFGLTVGIFTIVAGLSYRYYDQQFNSTQPIQPTRDWLPHLLRLVLISPLVYLGIFFQRQYVKARNLVETYAYKAIMIRALEKYNKTLKEQELTDNEMDKESFEFIKQTYMKILEPPSSVLTDRSEISVIEKILLKGIDKNNLLELIDKLKDLANKK